jgi:CRISPR-associated endonuclease/helicase Cas3
VDLVRSGGCCCVIANTVRQAQAIYQELELPESQRLLFHARFTASDRNRITEQVLTRFGKDTSRRPKEFVLVATQVVEQSLDVDFDHMISEIAPIDLLLQRSGRLHRHSRRAEGPVLDVLLPENDSFKFGGTGYVYAKKPLLRTVALLADRHEIRLPDQFRELIEHCYGTGEWDQEIVPWDVVRQADLEWEAEVQKLRSRARQFTLQEPRNRAFRPVRNEPVGNDSDDGNGWRANTRLGANDRTAVLVQQHEVLHLEAGEIAMAEVRSLYQRSLRLPSYLPIQSPADGYCPGVEATGRLRGLVLLPTSEDGDWQGISEKGALYRVSYDQRFGLRVGRVE